MSKRDIQRVETILSKIDMIDEIVNKFTHISIALEEGVMAKPAIMMHLTSIAEQFSKLSDEDMLNQFDQKDIKGAIATRNFIAHDYDGVNLGFIEDVIRDRLPKVRAVIKKILNP